MSDLFEAKMSDLFKVEVSREDKVRGMLGGAAWALLVLSLAGMGVLVLNAFDAGLSLAFVGNTTAHWNRDLWMMGLWVVVGCAGISVVCAIIGRRWVVLVLAALLFFVALFGTTGKLAA